MIRIGFFDAKPYDRRWFEGLRGGDTEIHYFEGKLNPTTVKLAQGMDAVCVFVNDEVDRAVLDALHGYGIRLVACAAPGSIMSTSNRPISASMWSGCRVIRPTRWRSTRRR